VSGSFRSQNTRTGRSCPRRDDEVRHVTGVRIRERCWSGQLAYINGTAQGPIPPSSGSARDRDRSDDDVHGFHDFIDSGVTPQVLLREHEGVSHGDFERTTTRRNERDVIDVMLVLVEDRLHHAHGTVGVTSGGAVFNGEMHPHRLGSLRPLPFRLSGTPPAFLGSCSATPGCWLLFFRSALSRCRGSQTRVR
jgi:hypothetical protein